MKKKIKVFSAWLGKVNKSALKCLAPWLDVILLVPGMAFIVGGVFLIFQPAGFIILGLCFIALAFFVANKLANGGDS
jgi:hypothetical protein